MENKKENTEVDSKPSNKPKRIDGHYLSHEIQHLLHFEKGFLFTARELLLRPGKAVREFIFDDRNKYVKPIIFLIFSSVIYTAITHFTHIKISFFNVDQVQFNEVLKKEIRTKEIGNWTDSHLGYTNLIMGVFIGLWTKVFFKNYNYNLFEIIVLLCFVLGEAILIIGLFLLTAKLFTSSIIQTIGIWVYFIYITWAIGQFFGEKKIMNYVKSVLTYVLGNISYLTTLVTVAYFFKKFVN
ncbi:MAG: DUF3667 domain-containing protein [Arcicella sp.]|nr:DUF3667 domain-containing protein [Arcicella sp.]